MSRQHRSTASAPPWRLSLLTCVSHASKYAVERRRKNLTLIHLCSNPETGTPPFSRHSTPRKGTNSVEPLNKLNMEGRVLGTPAARRQPRAYPRHRHTPGVRTPMPNSRSYDSEAGIDCVPRYTRKHETGAQQPSSSCTAQAVSNDSCSPLRRSASETVPRTTRPPRRCRTRTKNVSRQRVRRFSGKSSANRDSSSPSHSRSDPSNSGCEVDAGGGVARQDNTVESRGVTEQDVEDSGHGASRSLSLPADREQVAAEPTAGSAKTDSPGPDVAQKTALSPSPPESLAFSEAVDPFSSCPPPDSRSVFRRVFPCTSLFTGETAPCESSSLPSFSASLLALIKEKASLTPPALTASVILLLLFMCIALSLRLLLLQAPLRQASFRLLTQLSHDWSPTRTSSIRYCEQLRPVEVKWPLPVANELPLLPFPAGDLTRITKGQTAETDCHACPEHAICAGGHMKCLPYYVRVPAETAAKNSFFRAVIHLAKKLFRAEPNEGDVCVENVAAKRAAEEVVERIVLLLRKRAGDAQCGLTKICDRISSDGQTCLRSAESPRIDFVKGQKDGGKNFPSKTDGTMTRWELLQSEEIQQQLEDDSVYAYVFDRLLEEKAALRLNIQVKQQYSFESMRLPREDVATSSAFKGVSHDGVVAFFLREQRRSQGITYSYTYVGPHALRSLFCTFRLVFKSTVVPLSVVITALSALALPVAVWLRRFYLRRQLLVLMQQQQGEQQTLMKSSITGASGAIPVVYCGCSSAHLSQLLVQQTSLHRFSLVRWWLQLTATKIEEVDALCFELLHNKSACVQTVSHEGQNFWWVGKGISRPDQQTTAYSTSTCMCCPQARGNEHTPRPGKPVSLGSDLLDVRADAADALLPLQFSVPRRPSSTCASCSGPITNVDACSPAKCEPTHTCDTLGDKRCVEHSDEYTWTMRCRGSIPGPAFTASPSNGSATAATADPLTFTKGITTLTADRGNIQCASCIRSSAGCCGQHAFSSCVMTSHHVPEQSTGSQRTTKVDKFCHHSNDSGSQIADLGLPAELARLRRTSPAPSTDYSFSAFLARVSDMQRKTPERDFTNPRAVDGDGDSPYGAAGVDRGRFVT